MCGAETTSPRTAKIEGAELQVCDDCIEFGTEIETDTDSETTTKYSTSSTESVSNTQDTTPNRSHGSSTSRSQSSEDIFEEMDEVVSDYDQRIRSARESAGLSQTELADQLNEKASFIRKLERGESLPNDTIRRKLERALDIELVTGSSTESEGEWSSSDTPSGVTLGDVVERKD